MKWFDNTALTIVIIGAVNWLLVGIFRFDLVAFLFGNLSWFIQDYLYNRRYLWTLPDQLVRSHERYDRCLLIKQAKNKPRGIPMRLPLLIYLFSATKFY